MTTNPVWLTEALKHLGVKETTGHKHTPIILRWWQVIKRGGIKDDETPWCAAFVGAQLEAVGIRSSRFESARSYLTWGRALYAPAVGAVVVFERGRNSGHVGFVMGQNTKGQLVVIGGNQSNAVTIAAFERSRVLGYFWPAGHEIDPSAFNLPLLTASGVSSNES